MPQPRRPAPILLLAAGLAVGLLTGCKEPGTVPALPSQAFVWQRVWHPSVADAVRKATTFEALHVLAAELSHPEPPTLEPYTLARRHKLLADCAVVQLSRDDFAGALGTLLRTDYWQDAAYVAEYLISAEELLALARAGRLPRLTQMQVPDQDPPAALRLSHLKEKYGQWTRPAGLDPFTYLVARRLAREGYFKDALRLLPDDLGRALQRHAESLRRGRNAALGAEARGEALWTAAQIERQLGMELFGFETAPDHA